MDVKRCNGCGKVQDLSVVPPDVAPYEIRDPIATYELDVCEPCVETKSVAELKSKATRTVPGGTVTGAKKVWWMLKQRRKVPT